MDHEKDIGMVAGRSPSLDARMAADDLKNAEAMKAVDPGRRMVGRVAPIPQDMQRLMQNVGQYEGLLHTLQFELIAHRVRQLGRRTLLMDTPAHRAILAGFGLDALPGCHVAVDAFERRRFVADLKAGKVTFAQAERFGRLIGVEIDRATYNQIKTGAGA